MAEPMTDCGSKRSLRLLVLEDDAGVGYALGRWLRERHVQPILAATTADAMTMLQDAAFIQVSFDGLLADYNLPDASGMRVIQHFCKEYPALPVALMTGAWDLTLELWTRARHIPLFRKPLQMGEVEDWLQQVGATH